MATTLRALVVGINEYKDARYRHKARLRFAASDANHVAELLKNSRAFSTEKVTLLTNEQATKMAIQDVLHDVFSQRAFDRNTIALFYFAGHGIVNNYDKRISLCCHDVDFTDPEAGGIRLNDIYGWLSSTSAECVIVILDSCFSSGIIAGPLDYRSSAQQAIQAIEALRYPEGKTVAIFAACGSDETARERADLRHGVFTYELLRGWRDGQAQREGAVYLSGLSDFLLRDMQKYAQPPRASVVSSRPVLLWQQDALQPVLATPLPPPPPDRSRGQIQVLQTGQAGKISDPFVLPTTNRPQSSSIQERNKLIALFVGLALLAIVLFALLVNFIIHIFIH